MQRIALKFFRLILVENTEFISKMILIIGISKFYTMNNYALGGNTLEIERKLREDKKKLNWNDDTKPHYWNSVEAKKISKKGHRWNSDEAKKANKKGHHWNSDEAKKAAKKRWNQMNEISKIYLWIKDVVIRSPVNTSDALSLYLFADEFKISKEIIIEHALETGGDVENIEILILRDLK